MCVIATGLRIGVLGIGRSNLASWSLGSSEASVRRDQFPIQRLVQLLAGSKLLPDRFRCGLEDAADRCSNSLVEGAVLFLPPDLLLILFHYFYFS